MRDLDSEKREARRQARIAAAAANVRRIRSRTRAEHELPGYKGDRVVGDHGAYVLALPTSRKERGNANRSYKPHQGARECARRQRRGC